MRVRSCLTRVVGRFGCFMLMNFLLLVVFIIGTSYWDSHPDRGEHQPAFDGGPPEATDFCWYEGYVFTAYEFSCTEEQFRKWAIPSREFFEAKENRPFQIMRYTYPDTHYPSHVGHMENGVFHTNVEEGEREPKNVRQYKNEVYATICHGVYTRPSDMETAAGMTRRMIVRLNEGILYP